MTRLDPTGQLFGFPALTVRQVLRYARLRIAVETVQHLVGVGPRRARALIAALVDAGLLQPSSHNLPDYPTWTTTVEGNALAMASAAKPITRATADRLLRGFVDRARALDAGAHPEFCFRLERAVVFGSYLRPEVARLGDVDLAIQLSPLDADRDAQFERERRRIRSAMHEGRVFRNIVEELFWPREEVRRYLRGGSHSFSLHDLDGEAEILARGPSREVYPGTLEMSEYQSR